MPPIRHRAPGLIVAAFEEPHVSLQAIVDDVSEGIAKLRDGTLASSSITLNEALRLTTMIGIPATDAIMMASTTPTMLLGLDRLGRIDSGCIADLVLLDEEYNVKWTMINGEIRYSVTFNLVILVA